MSMMCPLDGCKQKKRMCIHEKMMMGMLAIVMVLGVVWLVK
jgi:hypothetical protein